MTAMWPLGLIAGEGQQDLYQKLGDRVPAHERARAEALIGEVRQALQDQSTTVERLRQMTGDLQQVSHALASSAYAQAGAAAAGAGAGSGATGPGASGGDDDVIDAEYTPK